VCTKYSAYFEMSKGNNEIFQVQILGSHRRSREVYRVCVDIIHSYNTQFARKVHFHSYVRVHGKGEEAYDIQRIVPEVQGDFKV
jgi:hypothetical protein